MAGVLIGQDGASQVAHDLMHIDQNLPRIFRVKGDRLHVRIDLGPLLDPVSADFLGPRTKPPLKALGQATSSVIVAGTASISRALKAA